MPGDNTVSQYTLNVTTGKLSAKFPFTVATGLGPSAIAVSSDGKSAYVTNTANPGEGGTGPASVSQYTIDPTTGQLSAKTPATIATGTDPLGIALSPDGRSAYVANAFSNPAEVSQYTVNPTTGALSPKSPATVPTNEPEGIAVSGNSAYVTNIGMDTVSQYTIDPTTGALHPKVPATVPTLLSLSPSGSQ